MNMNELPPGLFEDEPRRHSWWLVAIVCLLCVNVVLVALFLLNQSEKKEASEQLPATSFGMLRVSEDGQMNFFRPQDFEETNQPVVFGDTVYDHRDDVPILWLPEAIPERTGLQPFTPGVGAYLRRAGDQNGENITVASLPRCEDIPLLLLRNAACHPWYEQLLAPGSLLLLLPEEGER